MFLSGLNDCLKKSITCIANNNIRLIIIIIKIPLNNKIIKWLTYKCTKHIGVISNDKAKIVKLLNK